MRRLGSLAVLSLLGTAAQADVVQLSVNTDVMQTFDYYGPNPTELFTHGNGYQEYIFFQQYVDSVYDAGIWREDELNISLDNAPTEITSFGRLNAVWTFDDSMLAQDLTGYTDPEGSVIGSYGLNSTFQITTQLGDTDGAVSGSVNVLAVNNWAVDDGVLDVIGIQAELPSDNPDEDNFGVVLLLSGGSTWFEDARDAGEKLDLTTLERAAVLYENYHFEDRATDYVAYSVMIEGEVGRDQMSYRNFGAADGSDEDAPLLPNVIGDEEGAPSFAFDLSDLDVGSQMVFIDPEIAVGYEYSLTGGGEITAIQAPSLGTVNDADGYLVTLPDGTSFRILPNETVTLTAPVTSFTLSDIDPSLMLDPLDQTTFVLGMQFLGLDQTSQLTQTALVIDTDTPAVPLPAGIVLLASGVAGLGLARRKRKAA